MAPSLPWFADNAFPLYLAPMAGVTDPVFRTLCKQLGADVMVTEFVSAEGVIQAWERNRRYVRFVEEHRPLGIQIFGSVPEHMAEAARIIAGEMRPDFIDLNAGCPVPKVVGKNGGSSLLKDLPLLERIAQALVEAVGDETPVTAKIRAGWDARSLCALEACRRLENAGVAAIAVHGRTRSQQYGGRADWELIDQCARAAAVPVIGNGDVTSPEDIERIRKTTAVSGVMIGRAAMSEPWIFQRAKAFLQTGVIPPTPPAEERRAFMLRHAELAVASGHYGSELHTMRAMRSRLLAYSKGLPGMKPLRPQLARVESVSELRRLLEL